MNRAERAVSLKHSGYNCCQSVLLAFDDVLREDRETLIRAGAPFAVGMGNMKGDCGALIGAELVMGLLSSDQPVIRHAREILNRFEEQCGDIVCCELKGVYTGVMRCSCDDCIRNAVKIVGEIIDNR